MTPPFFFVLYVFYSLSFLFLSVLASLARLSLHHQFGDRRRQRMDSKKRRISGHKKRSAKSCRFADLLLPNN